MLLVATLLLIGACDVFAPVGVRLLHARYSVDGEVLLDVLYEDPDADPAADVWDYLATPPLQMPGTTSEIVPDPVDPLRATLRGDVVVEIAHVDLTLRRAELDELQIVRDSADTLCWHMTEETKDRTRPPR